MGAISKFLIEAARKARGAGSAPSAPPVKGVTPIELAARKAKEEALKLAQSAKAHVADVDAPASARLAEPQSPPPSKLEKHRDARDAYVSPGRAVRAPEKEGSGKVYGGAADQPRPPVEQDAAGNVRVPVRPRPRPGPPKTQAAAVDVQAETSKARSRQAAHLAELAAQVRRARSQAEAKSLNAAEGRVEAERALRETRLDDHSGNAQAVDEIEAANARLGRATKEEADVLGRQFELEAGRRELERKPKPRQNTLQRLVEQRRARAQAESAAQLNDPAAKGGVVENAFVELNPLAKSYESAIQQHVRNHLKVTDEGATEVPDLDVASIIRNEWHGPKRSGVMDRLRGLVGDIKNPKKRDASLKAGKERDALKQEALRQLHERYAPPGASLNIGEITDRIIAAELARRPGTPGRDLLVGGDVTVRPVDVRKKVVGEGASSEMVMPDQAPGRAFKPEPITPSKEFAERMAPEYVEGKQTPMPGGLPRSGSEPAPFVWGEGRIRKLLTFDTGKPVLKRTGKPAPVYGKLQAADPTQQPLLTALQSQLPHVTDPTIRKKIEAQIKDIIGDVEADAAVAGGSRTPMVPRAGTDVRSWKFSDLNGNETGRPLVLHKMGEGKNKRSVAERRFFRNIGPEREGMPDRYVEVDRSGNASGLSAAGPDGRIRPIAERDVAHMIDKGYIVAQAPKDIARTIAAPKRLGLRDPEYVAGWLNDYLDPRETVVKAGDRQARWALGEIKKLRELSDQEPYQQAVMALGRGDALADAPAARGPGKKVPVLESDGTSTKTRTVFGADGRPTAPLDVRTWEAGLQRLKQLEAQLGGQSGDMTPSVAERGGLASSIRANEEAIDRFMGGGGGKGHVGGATMPAPAHTMAELDDFTSDLMATVYRNELAATKDFRHSRQVAAEAAREADRFRTLLEQTRQSGARELADSLAKFVDSPESAAQRLEAMSRASARLEGRLELLRRARGGADQTVDGVKLREAFAEVPEFGSKDASTTPGREMLAENEVWKNDPEVLAHNEALAILRHEQAAAKSAGVDLNSWFDAATRGAKVSDDSILAAVSAAVDARHARGVRPDPTSASEEHIIDTILESYPKEAQAIEQALASFTATDQGESLRRLAAAGYKLPEERGRLFAGVSESTPEARQSRLQQLIDSPEEREAAMQRIVDGYRGMTLEDHPTAAGQRRLPRRGPAGAETTDIDIEKELSRDPLWQSEQKMIGSLGQEFLDADMDLAVTHKLEVAKKYGFSPHLTPEEMKFLSGRTKAGPYSDERNAFIQRSLDANKNRQAGASTFIPHAEVTAAAQKVAKDLGVDTPLAFKGELETRTIQQREVSKSEIEDVRKRAAQVETSGQARIGAWLDQSPENRRFLETGQGQAWLDSAAGQAWLSKNQAIEAPGMNIPAFRPQARWLQTPGGRRWLQTEQGKQFVASGQAPLPRLEGPAAKKLNAMASAVASRGRNFAKMDLNDKISRITKATSGRSKRSQRDAFDDIVSQLATGKAYGPVTESERDLAKKMASGAYDYGAPDDGGAPAKRTKATSSWGDIPEIDNRVSAILAPRARGTMGAIDTDPAVFLGHMTQELSRRLGRVVTPQEVVASGIFGKSTRLSAEDAQNIAELAVNRVGVHKTPSQLMAEGVAPSTLKAAPVDLPPHPLDPVNRLVDEFGQRADELGSISDPNSRAAKAAELMRQVEGREDLLKRLQLIRPGGNAAPQADAGPRVLRAMRGVAEQIGLRPKAQRPITGDDIGSLLERLQGIRGRVQPHLPRVGDVAGPGDATPDFVQSYQREQDAAARKLAGDQIAAANARPDAPELERGEISPFEGRFNDNQRSITIAFTPEEAERVIMAANGDVLEASGMGLNPDGTRGPIPEAMTSSGEMSPVQIAHSIAEAQPKALVGRRATPKDVTLQFSRQYRDPGRLGIGVAPEHRSTGVLVEGGLVPAGHSVIVDYDPDSRQILGAYRLPVTAVEMPNKAGGFSMTRLPNYKHGDQLPGGASTFEWMPAFSEHGGRPPQGEPLPVGFPSGSEPYIKIEQSRPAPAPPEDLARTQVSGDDFTDVVSRLKRSREALARQAEFDAYMQEARERSAGAKLFQPVDFEAPLQVFTEKPRNVAEAARAIDRVTGVRPPEPLRPPVTMDLESPTPPPAAPEPAPAPESAPPPVDAAEQSAQRARIAAALARARRLFGPGSAGALAIAGPGGEAGPDSQGGDTNLVPLPSGASVLDRVRAARNAAGKQLSY